MSERPIIRFSPDLETLEAKLALSVTTSPVANLSGVPQVAATATTTGHKITAQAVKPNFGYLVYRITNPTLANNHLTPPFGHVLVQNSQPIPGQIYNVLSIILKNGTMQTFNASSGFTVTLPGERQPVPILTGNEAWLPGQNFIFYVLSKKYYPLASQVSDGFKFNLGGAKSVAIPGPSAIFLRIKYNPATINHVLDVIMTTGPGAQGGSGIKFGLPDTALWEFVSATTKRNDFGGYF
jgi:hypothetical protein